MQEENGPRFVSNVFAPFCGFLALEHLKTITHYLQRKEQVERLKKTIAARLRHHVAGHQDS